MMGAIILPAIILPSDRMRAVSYSLFHNPAALSSGALRCGINQRFPNAPLTVVFKQPSTTANNRQRSPTSLKADSRPLLLPTIANHRQPLPTIGWPREYAFMPRS